MLYNLICSEPSMTFSVSYAHITVVTVTVMLPNFFFPSTIYYTAHDGRLW